MASTSLQIVEAIAEPAPARRSQAQHDGEQHLEETSAAADQLEAPGATEPVSVLPAGVLEGSVEALASMGFERASTVGWLYYFRGAEDPAAEAVIRLVEGEMPPPIVNQNQAVSNLMELFSAARAKPSRKDCEAALESCDGIIYDGNSFRKLRDHLPRAGLHARRELAPDTCWGLCRS